MRPKLVASAIVAALVVGGGTSLVLIMHWGNVGSGRGATAPASLRTRAKGVQAITFTGAVPTSAVVGGPTYTPTATGGASGHFVTFSIDRFSTSDCSLSDGVVSFPTTAGTCVIDANQVGSANYDAAPQVQESFTVAYPNSLLGVTCVNVDDCWAVGSSRGPSGPLILIEQNTGSGWTPNTSLAANGGLTAVTCVSASDCWAVGYLTDGLPGSSERTAFAQYDGTAWSLATSPPNYAGDTPLEDVSCWSADGCMAVGNVTLDPAYYHLTQSSGFPYQYNGISWSVDSYPLPSGATGTGFDGVTCLSGRDCWAVGWYWTGAYGADDEYPLIEQFNGTSWSVSSSPAPPAHGELDSVACATATDCWAVGSDWGAANQDATFARQYSATGWAIVSSPDPSGSTQSTLNRVTCLSASVCLAVGSSSGETLAEEYSDSQGSIVSRPNPSGGTENVLSGVACPTSSDCWAVGSYTDASGVGQALTEQLAGTAWSLSSSSI
jgi:hypothetical protein